MVTRLTCYDMLPGTLNCARNVMPVRPGEDVLLIADTTTDPDIVEAYKLASQGTPDSLEVQTLNNFATMLSNRFDEIFPYCVEITGNYMPMSLVISEDVFQKLTAEQQEVVTKAAEEACQYWDDRQDEVQQGAMDMLAASKAEMCRMEPAELAKMDGIIHDAMEKYLSETIGADLMAQVRALTD